MQKYKHTECSAHRHRMGAKCQNMGIIFSGLLWTRHFLNYRLKLWKYLMSTNVSFYLEIIRKALKKIKHCRLILEAGTVQLCYMFETNKMLNIWNQSVTLTWILHHHKYHSLRFCFGHGVPELLMTHIVNLQTYHSNH